MDWNLFDWFHNTKRASAGDVDLVTPFGHFKNENQLWNFCHNKWQSLSRVYYENNLNDFRYLTMKLLELGGICEYKEYHDNGIYEMFIKPNCYNTVNVVYFKKGNSNMNANKRLQKDEHKLNKAQSTIKSVKRDIKQVRNQQKHSNEYLVLALYDCLNSDKTGFYESKNHDNYYVIIKDGDGFMISSSMTFHDVMNSPICWFDKNTAEELRSKLFCNEYSCSMPDVLSKQDFKKRYGHCE